MQAVLAVTPEKVSKQMVKWAASLADESIVLVEGTVKKSPIPILGASVGDVEVHVHTVSINRLIVWKRRLRHSKDPPYFWNRRTAAFFT